MDNSSRPIIIEGAMESEMSIIFAAMTDRQDGDIMCYPVTHGCIDGYPVIAARTRVGMTNAAILTTALCMEYSPLCIISQGTAGSHCEDLHTGDIVLGEKLCCMNSFAMAKDDARELEALSRGEWHARRTFESDENLLNIARSVPYPHGRLVGGAIGSADFWTHGDDNIRALRENYGTTCEEMESFAAAWACDRAKTPFLAIRVLSNNELIGEDFDVKAAEYCQEYTLDVMRRIINGKNMNRAGSISE